MSRKKSYLLAAKIAAYLVCAGALLYMLYISPYNPHPRSVADIRTWVLSYGAWAPFIYIVIYTIRPILFFPTLILNLSAGVLFGPWWGILFVLAGGLGCASFCYVLGRFGGGSWLLHHFGGRLGGRLKQYLVGEGSFTKMLWLRTVPIFPYDPVSIIAGSVHLPYRIYALATVLGMLPGAIAYNFLADAFGTTRFYLAIGITILAFGIPLFLWKKGQKGKTVLDYRDLGKDCEEDGQE